MKSAASTYPSQSELASDFRFGECCCCMFSSLMLPDSGLNRLSFSSSSIPSGTLGRTTTPWWFAVVVYVWGWLRGSKRWACPPRSAPPAAPPDAPLYMCFVWRANITLSTSTDPRRGRHIQLISTSLLSCSSSVLFFLLNVAGTRERRQTLSFFLFFCWLFSVFWDQHKQARKKDTQINTHTHTHTRAQHKRKK